MQACEEMNNREIKRLIVRIIGVHPCKGVGPAES